ncbi:MAG: PP2C family protein-serine/threonine phosphatase [Phycisphaerales bacterium]|nr:MAG: PP2C family protein-serine/threonine phosphatase [Phycisphaerales bacterium]
MTEQRDTSDFLQGDWQVRLAQVVETMREMSRQTDPQAMVLAYRKHMNQLMPVDRMVSLSRRGIDPPKYRITRSSIWKEEINPWKEKDRLPLLEGGLLGDLIYGDEPWVIDDLQPQPGDPAAKYLAGQRSLLAIPLYDRGVALNMVVFMRRQPNAFDREQLPQYVWLANLFGRASHNLVLASQVQEAYDELDRELETVGDIQRSLLPAKLPSIATMELAAHYETSRRAGGDYYDFFPLPDGKLGILIADVSGHSTAAAVGMAVTYSLAHASPGPPTSPGKLLTFVNRHLATRYTIGFGTFVTAFYGIYNPATRELTYANAGHVPPRVKRCADRSILSLGGARHLPLGINADETFTDAAHTLVSGDQVVFYTDGITEAFNPAGETFGLVGLDRALERCRNDVNELIEAVLAAVKDFTTGRAADDDRTLLVAKIK